MLKLDDRFGSFDALMFCFGRSPLNVLRSPTTPSDMSVTFSGGIVEKDIKTYQVPLIFRIDNRNIIFLL